jgi:glycosyltransferase involved in cell wall biosynthesis
MADASRIPARPRLALLGCRGIPARYGGFETFAEELGARLVARGVEVTVYCEAGPGPRPFEHRGVRLEHLAVPRLGPASALVYDLAALRHARARHDVVYMLGYGAGAFLGLGRRPGNQVWVNMDGLEWRRSKWGWLARAWLRRMERAALARADRIVFDSAAVRAVVLGGAQDARSTVIEYGAELGLTPDPGVLETLGLRARAYFLLVARIEPENHVLEVVRAHARAELDAAPHGPPGVELVVVGDVARAGRYGLACRAAAAPSVRFLGPLFDARTLFTLRQGALAVVHGHSVGGTNPSLLEAMAAGVPVVAHANAFNREVLGERAVGLAGGWFADEDGLVSALRAAAGHTSEERARRGAALRERCEERYTWERIADEYARLLGLAPAAAAHAPEPPAPLPAVRAGARSPAP